MHQGVFSTVITPAYIHHKPGNLVAPVILESPHHSLYFPDTLTTCEHFRLACDMIHALRQADLHVDRIIRSLPRHGIPVLEATTARSYIDLNRAPNSVHPDHISGSLTQITPATDDFYAEVGLGLVRTRAYFGCDNIRIIDDAPTENEILARLDRYWYPYHAQLEKMIDKNISIFGESVHISCHSFPLSCMREQNDLKGHTFFIGTADETTADPAITDFIIASLESMGFRVARNHILKGQELVKRHGHPQEGRHSLQIEIVREAYMDCDTCQPHEGFESIQQALSRLTAELGDFMRNRCRTPAPSSAAMPDRAQTSAHHDLIPGQ
ncbi:MAG: N-formylglutamate amidohydrolase [Rhodospirillales bacterium]|nr:N-formylglutamate amidohydrolase [Rhodospirillales bacterium]